MPGIFNLTDHFLELEDTFLSTMLSLQCLLGRYHCSITLCLCPFPGLDGVITPSLGLLLYLYGFGLTLFGATLFPDGFVPALFGLFL